MIRLFERLTALAKVRDLERQLQALIDLQADSDCQDASIRHGWALKRETISQQLARSRAAYVAEYMEPGKRLIYEVA